MGNGIKRYGEENLSSLLSNMEPILLLDEYIFCSIQNKKDIDKLNPISIFQEKEGISLIITKDMAIKNHIDFKSTFKCITLKVHSSLDAIGLTATVSTALSEEGISANVVAGFYHDHIFVPTNLAKQALEVLKLLSKI